VHRHKGSFTRNRKSKLMLRGDGSFHSFKGVNVYKVDLQGEYNVSAIFKVYNLSLFDISDDLMSNYFEERGDDVIVAMT